MPVQPKYAVFALLYLGWCVSYLDRAAMTLSVPAMLHDIHMSPTRQGFVLGVFYLGYSCMQIPGGWLADRFGSKPVVLAGLVLWSLFTLGTGLVATASALLLVRLLFGMGEGIFPAASIKALYDVFPAAARDKAPSALMSSNYFGYLVAPALLLPLLAWGGWRRPFLVMSIAGLACAAAYLVLAPGRARQSAPRAPASGRMLADVLRARGIRRLMGVWFLVSFINKALESWMPTYLLHERGVSLKAAGVLLTLPYVAATLAAASGGWIMARWFRDREHHFMSANILLSCAALLAMAHAPGVNGVVAAETCLYFFKSLVFAAILSLPARMLSADSAGSGFGLINFGGQFAGFVAPPVIGALLGAFHSYPLVFLSLVGAGALALVFNAACGRFPSALPLAE